VRSLGASVHVPPPAPPLEGLSYKDDPRHIGHTTFALPRPHPADPSLRTLTGMAQKMQGDCERHLGMSDVLASRNTKSLESAMERRYDLRQEFLEGVPIFSLDVVTREEQSALVRSLRYSTFSRHECLLREGEVSNRIVIIERGECNAVRGGDVVGQPVQGSFFGEAAVVFNVTSKVGLVAASEVGALWLTKQDVLDIVRGPSLVRMQMAARARLCAEVPALADLPYSQLVRIAAHMYSERWRRGSTLAGPMHAASRLFIVEDGECQVQENDHRGLLTSSMLYMQASQNLEDGNRLRPGQFFGMEGLLDGSEMGCSVVAASSEVRTLSISHEEILASCGPEERSGVATQMNASMQVYLLRQVPLLRSLSKAAFSVVRAQATEVLFKPWSAIVMKGSALDAVFVLKSGKVAEYNGSISVLQDLSKVEFKRPESVTPGDCFGSEALLDPNSKAKTTLLSLTHASLLKVERQAVVAVMQDRRERLERVPILSSAVLSMPEQMSVVSRMRAWQFSPNHTIAMEGELAERLFVLESGVCEAVKDVDGQAKFMAHLESGACFGELAVFFNEPRKMTVRTVSEVTVLTLNRDDLAAAIPPAKLQQVDLFALTQCLSDIPLLKRLDPQTRRHVAERCHRHTWRAGEFISRRLVPCDSLFFIESGTCLAAREEAAKGSRLVPLRGESELVPARAHDDGAMILLGPGQYFGMCGLLTCTALGMSVWAESEQVRTASISCEELVSSAGPDRRREVQASLREALRLHFLRQIPPLQELPDEELLMGVFSRCQELAYAKGEVVVSKGSVCEAFYVLEEGEVLEHPEGPQEARDMWWRGRVHEGPGTCFPPGAAYKQVKSGSHANSFSLVAKGACKLLRVPLAALKT